jgi:hypothetical protein
VEEEILHEGSMPGTVIYISEFQNKLAWKFGISVSFREDDLINDVILGGKQIVPNRNLMRPPSSYSTHL